TLRSAADADAMRSCLQRTAGGELLVIGGGFIGLEVAATARHLGWQVQVLEAAPRLLMRSASPELSAHILQVHREMGTSVHLGVNLGGFEHGGARLQSLQIDGVSRAVDEVLL